MIVKDLFTTACLLTGQTERASRRLGVRFFLPELFRLRYANMGGLDPAVFTRQLDALHSFEESAWCGHWNAIAREYEEEAKHLSAGNGDQNALVDLLIKASTYYTVSAFPGHTPQRLDAYEKARALSYRIAPMLDPHVELVTVQVAGEEVRGYLRLPPDDARHPFVLVTNGLEGTVAEISLPLMNYRDSNIGVF